MKHVAIILLKAYQRFLSPLLPNSCRFYPTCSQYAIEAIREHGMIRGAWLGIKRIGRCHPFHPGGHDPVPPASKSRDSSAARKAGPAGDPDEQSRHE